MPAMPLARFSKSLVFKMGQNTTRFMTQFQSLRVYGGYFWLGEQTIELAEGDRA